ncbi:hypothetical protein D9758_009905 [Tetrapyrgos nigripes]|uniref:T-complex protein 1 subunit beta n=1 Tax=Tetrapyrgos nigripes TaxID=182062 RepID=A0A8H5GMJ8_9AGAR|nr:hypothetical protein D9758_009905 [Tetrapyrgos nigripes]
MTEQKPGCLKCSGSPKFPLTSAHKPNLSVATTGTILPYDNDEAGRKRIKLMENLQRWWEPERVTYLITCINSGFYTIHAVLLSFFHWVMASASQPSIGPYSFQKDCTKETLIMDLTGKLAELERAEKEKMAKKVENIAKHGVNVFINRQLVYNYPESLLAEKGILVIEHADFDGVERLSRVTGGEIVSTFGNLDKVKLGYAQVVEEVMIGEDKLIKFSGLPSSSSACTVVLHSLTNQILDEAERSLHDALSVLSQTASTEHLTVLGGDCSEMLMVCAVDTLARETTGKKSVAIESFAKALRTIPVILAGNAGLDATELVAELRAEHFEGCGDKGLDLTFSPTGEGRVGSMRELGLVSIQLVTHQDEQVRMVELRE